MWLKRVKGESDGIILIHHEERKINPAILMNTLTKYKLLDEFCHIVKGFANGYDITKAKCDNTISSYSIRTLSRVLLNEVKIMINKFVDIYFQCLIIVTLLIYFFNQEKNVSSANVRANLLYRILHHLSNGEIILQSEIVGDDIDKTTKRIFKYISEFIRPTDNEKKAFESRKVIADRQFSLMPIFNTKKTTRREHRYLTPLRRLLAESKIDYSLLQVKKLIF